MVHNLTHPALPVLRAQAPGAPSQAAAKLPTVEALEKLWERAQSRPFFAPRSFFKLLALRAKMHLKLLDPARQGLSVPVGKANDCTSCTEICCVGPRAQVLLRLRDIAMLHDIGRTSLMTHDKTAYSASELRTRPALARQVHARDWSIFPKLRQNAFGACHALTQEGLCSLFPHWPMTCARFPYSLHVSDEEIFFSSRCQSYFVHPSRQPEVTQGRLDAVATYNERIKDAILLVLYPEELSQIGLTQYLRL